MSKGDGLVHNPDDIDRSAAQQTPRVSVIIPTFHREEQLVRAVQSVLDEGIEAVEIRVIDDSPEGTARMHIESIGDPRVHYSVMDQPTGGVPAIVRNQGMRDALGDVLYFLDDDDMVAPGGLSAMLSALDRDSGAGVAFGTVDCFGPDAEVVDSYNQWFTWAASTAEKFRRSSWLTVGIVMFRGTLIINSVCCVRRSVALEMGGYDSSIPLYEDVEFFLRSIRASGHVFVDHPVLRYSTGMSSLIHDLDGDFEPVADSYKIMHRKYRETNGELDYRALQVMSKLLPLSSPEGRLV